MKYEWDENKNQLNLKKHKLNFEDAQIVLEGECLSLEDQRHAYGEERLITIGHLAGRMVIVVSTRRENTQRIISMRKANEREQKKYKNRFKGT